MADSFTPRLNLVLIENGTSASTWGSKTSDNLSKVDAGVGALQDRATALEGTRALKAGDAFTGPITAPLIRVDANGYLTLSEGNPVLAFDSGDYLHFNRANNTLAVVVGGAGKLYANSTDVVAAVPLTLAVGAIAAGHAVRKDYVDGLLANTVSRHGDSLGGDLRVFRPAQPATGVVYLGNADKGLYWDGLTYSLLGSGVVHTTGNLDPAAFFPASGGTLAGNLGVQGRLDTAGDIGVNGGLTVVGGANLVAGASVGGLLRVTGQRVVSEGQSNPAFCCHNTAGGVASGMLLNSENVLHFSQMDGQGNHVGTRAYIDGANNFVAAGQVYSNSDARLKTDVAPLAGGLDAVLALQPVSYRRKDGDGRLQAGLIAQAVLEVAPEAVNAGPDDFLAVSYAGLVPHMLAALKELAARVAALEAA